MGTHEDGRSRCSRRSLAGFGHPSVACGERRCVSQGVGRVLLPSPTTKNQRERSGHGTSRAALVGVRRIGWRESPVSEWTDAASFATAGGTLVLAIATFA